MEKKVPKSEKYAHIQGKLDTGLNINKVKVVTAREFAKRRDEIFFRVTKGQLFELLHEYEADEQERITDNEVYGQGPRIVTYSELAEPDYNRPYLILDVREASSYNTCHILQSRNFPFALLRRDQMHPEIFKFKNKEEHLIILYCDDERISRDAASTLVDRGIDNVFLLNGGLKEFAGSYSMYVEGDIPLEWLPVKSNQSRSSKSYCHFFLLSFCQDFICYYCEYYGLFISDRIIRNS